MASCGVEDTCASIWDIRKNKIVKKLEINKGSNNGYINKLQFDITGNYITMCGDSGYLADVKLGEVSNVVKSRIPITGLSLVGSKLIAGSADGYVSIYGLGV